MTQKKLKAWNRPKLIVIYKPAKESQETVLWSCKAEFTGIGPTLMYGGCMDYMPYNGCIMPCSNQNAS